MRILQKLKSEDNAVKYLLELDDQQTVEALYMHDKDRALTYHSTVCISSQVGCAMGCRFCATGAQGFIRQLTADEIAKQVFLVDNERQNAGFIPLDAVVFAGMGEPLQNTNNVFDAIVKIQQALGLNHFELATVGIAPEIRALGSFVTEHNLHLRLNLSLHAPTDDKRRQLMPITQRFSIEESIEAAVSYAKLTGTTVRIRYMLIRGVNDTDADIIALRRLLSGKPVKLILSAYNDNSIQGLESPDPLDVLNFYHKIKSDIDSDIFKNFGASIFGGCGQLRGKCGSRLSSMPRTN